MTIIHYGKNIECVDIYHTIAYYKYMCGMYTHYAYTETQTYT